MRTVATLIHEILPKYTAMPVELITERLIIEPSHGFIIPAQRDLHVLDGEFRLKPISKPRGWPDVITVFLRSLAENWDGQIIAVIDSSPVHRLHGPPTHSLDRHRAAGAIESPLDARDDVARIAHHAAVGAPAIHVDDLVDEVVR